MSDSLQLLILFVILAIIAIAIFVVIALSTGRPSGESSEPPGGYVIRRRWFLVLILVLFACFFTTIPFVPYETAAMALQPALRVPVVAHQYFFDMPSHLPLNRRIMFEVTSDDVNHGFAIYGPRDHLIAQTQAMPDYVNYLAVTFHRPGKYKVRCLEFCGPGHFAMDKAFTVGGAP